MCVCVCVCVIVAIGLKKTFCLFCFLIKTRLSAKIFINQSVKPVLNWANVCSPNILRTVRRTMIHFLIELLVRRAWFGQFDEYTSFLTVL